MRLSFRFALVFAVIQSIQLQAAHEHENVVCGRVYSQLAHKSIPGFLGTREYGGDVSQRQMNRKGGIAAAEQTVFDLENRFGATRGTLLDTSKPLPNVTYGLNQTSFGVSIDATSSQAAARLRTVLKDLRPTDSVFHLKGSEVRPFLDGLRTKELKDADGKSWRKDYSLPSEIADAALMGVIMNHWYEKGGNPVAMAAVGGVYALGTVGRAHMKAKDTKERSYNVTPHLDGMIAAIDSQNGNGKWIYLGMDHQNEPGRGVDLLFQNSVEPQLTVILRDREPAEEKDRFKDYFGNKTDADYAWEKRLKKQADDIRAKLAANPSKTQETKLRNRLDNLYEISWRRQHQQERAEAKLSRAEKKAQKEEAERRYQERKAKWDRKQVEADKKWDEFVESVIEDSKGSPKN